MVNKETLDDEKIRIIVFFKYKIEIKTVYVTDYVKSYVYVCQCTGFNYGTAMLYNLDYS